MNNDFVEIWTDGSVSQISKNPITFIGGWCYNVRTGSEVYRELLRMNKDEFKTYQHVINNEVIKGFGNSGNDPDTTISRMELQAILEGLQAIIKVVAVSYTHLTLPTKA